MVATFSIEELARAMSSPAHGGHIDAGYTYLGQMISHDIVAPAASDHPRTVTSSLNLDSLYGDGHTAPVNGDCFLIQDDRLDLLRRDGIARIPEPRNDENVIVAQLHLLWQRIHNLLVTCEHFTFDEARDRVVQLFQAVIIHDYLPQILAPAVYDLYFKQAATSRFLRLDTGSMPAVFSRAAFRFGHSMVRSSYALNEHGEQPLSNLFLSNTGIPDQQKIDCWQRFFGSDQNTAEVGIEPGATFEVETQKAGRIDTKITSEMTRIQRPGTRVDITAANLKAGSDAGLPPGASYVAELLASPNGSYYREHLALKPLLEIRAGNLSHVRGLTIDNMPLWPYLLLEAESFNDGSSGSLGIAGSLIVADVLYGSITSSTPSYNRAGNPDQLLGLMGDVGAQIRANARSRSEDGRTICMNDITRTVELMDPT
ncbi:MAG: hypothetical protein O3B72_02395 [Proteobacteria bacterium]|nr:hypothetical protein [Pseudomonadota bacterium]